MNINTIKFDTQTGLVPAIIQDIDTKQVLMLGYMNKESLGLTLETKKVTFYSRSRQEIWVKGETSGNYLNLISIDSDCDNDTLLIFAKPEGPTCHTGSYNCFDIKKQPVLDFLPKLQGVIDQRKKEMPEGSYTTHLFTKGIDKIAQKVGEEAVETIIEAKNTNDNLLLNESADLLYHLMVLLSARNLSIKDVENILAERHK
jgi:phosphoribosyl-ATP pyrophosphohydrolase/phosphoribosyl-AMP cyclohydrolase